MFQMGLKRKKSASPPSPRNPKRRATPGLLNNQFHRPAKIKIKFAMELKRKRSASPPSPRSPKRRATPAAEESPIGLLFNDVGVKALMEVIQNDDSLVGFGKKFLTSLQVLMSKNSPEEGAKDIYDRAREVWLFDYKYLISACTYAIDEEPCFSDTLLAYANHDAPELRMASMMKDPWLDYILGNHVLGRRKPDAFIRGFLSVLIAYWNMKDLLDKYQVSKYGRGTETVYVPPRDEKFIHLDYAVDHFHDFQNLKEVLDSTFGSDPDLVGRLFKQISRFQKNGMELRHIWKSGRRSTIGVVLCSVDSAPLNLCETFWFSGN